MKRLILLIIIVSLIYSTAYCFMLQGKGQVASGATSYTAKSVILDIADNYVQTYLSIRQVDFWYSGSKITMTSGFTTYATTQNSASYDPDYAFDTSTSKTGTHNSTSWLSALDSNTNQRVIIVFDSSQTFDGIRINNAHDSGGAVARGAKNVVINISTDAISDTTYNAAIANSTEIFDSVFAQHSGVDEEDEEILDIGL